MARGNHHKGLPTIPHGPKLPRVCTLLFIRIPENNRNF
jgi:hypothetical protein